MGKLIYSMITSLDGCVSDADGNFDFGAADAELHRFIAGIVQSVGTYLYGRRMYETMVFWETADSEPGAPDFVRDYARVWQDTEKVVYSTTLSEVSSSRTRLERSFDPDDVRRLKADSELDLTIDGPELAAQAVRAGLVDEFQLYVAPVVVGGGKRFFPDDVRVDLELLDERRFDSGVAYLRYRVT